MPVKLYSLLIFLCLSFTNFAQIIESFDDGDFTANPQWFGQATKFEVIDPPTTSVDGALNSSANDDGLVLRSKQGQNDAILVLPSTQSNGEWRFSIADGYGWETSNLNDYKIILMSDDSTATNLTDGAHNFNGYFIQVDGSFDDVFNLYKQTGNTSTIILNTNYPLSVDGVAAVGRTVKVIRTATGDWSVFIDEGFGINPVSQRGGIVNDNTHTTSTWFGIATNIKDESDKRVLYFDELYIGDIIADTTKPSISNIEIINSNSLDIQFTESVEDTSSENTTNYFVNNGIGNPDSAIIDASITSLVHLYFSNSFTLGLQNTITIQNIEDLSENIMDIANTDFTYIIISPYDVVINEIMANPASPIGLPEHEFIELFNTTNFDLNISEWKLVIGSTTKTIPSIILPANNYFILCDDADVPEFQTYGNVVGITSFPTLTNTGISVTIKDENDTTISTVSYTDQWYQDPTKEDGGWTLEKIDPNNNCGGYTNWKASVSSTGGTPGQQNSVYASNIDTVAPFIEELAAVLSTQLTIKFSETIDIATLSVSNFSVDQGIGNPIFFEQDANDDLVYNLYFTNNFITGNTYILTVENIVDDCNNTLIQQNEEFVYYKAKQYDIVINEIMADPSPVIMLPEYEYLELYNRSDHTINLTNWTIKIGTSIKPFPITNIDSKNYLILTSSNAYSSFSQYGNVLDVLGTSDLNNSGEDITLYDNFNNIIFYLNYSDTWYQDDYKAEGGWSLEQIDTENLCGGSLNWIASKDNKGGTPGQQNSVFDTNPDNDIPELLRAIVLSYDSIKIFFNESFDSTTVFTASVYEVDNGIGNPIIIDPVEPDYSSIVLKFQQSFTKHVIYTITIKDSITDCVGNLIGFNSSCKFAIPDTIINNDILINEILFNPYTEGVDFVEIYNRSQKVFDLADIRIATRNIDDTKEEYMKIENIKEINSEGYLIFPNEYYVFSENSSNVSDIYYTSNENGLIDIDDLPAMSNDEGDIIIMDKWVNIIDEFHYYEDMHFDLLNDFKGVSLERINYDRISTDETNWHSAAETVGFATPAYKNSQFSEMENTTDEINVYPEVFSPDNDGYNDILNIEYLLDNPGFVANITILDARGRIIKKLTKNELLATTGIISWNGLTDANTKAKIGIYLIYVEVFDLEGNVKRYKKTCVLATKLN